MQAAAQSSGQWLVQTPPSTRPHWLKLQPLEADKLFCVLFPARCYNFIKLSKSAIAFNNRFLSDKRVIPPSPATLERQSYFKSIKGPMLHACHVIIFKVILKSKFQMEMFWMCWLSSLLVSHHGASEVSAAGSLPGQHPLQELNIGAGCTKHFGTC